MAKRAGNAPLMLSYLKECAKRGTIRLICLFIKHANAIGAPRAIADDKSKSLFAGSSRAELATRYRGTIRPRQHSMGRWFDNGTSAALYPIEAAPPFCHKKSGSATPCCRPRGFDPFQTGLKCPGPTAGLSFERRINSVDFFLNQPCNPALSGDRHSLRKRRHPRRLQVDALTDCELHSLRPECPLGRSSGRRRNHVHECFRRGSRPSSD